MAFSSVASLAKRGAAPNDEDNEPEPEPEGRNIDPTMAKELWERSTTDSNAEAAKGWAMLNNQIQMAGNLLAEELWDKAAVTISKRNQHAFYLLLAIFSCKHNIRKSPSLDMSITCM